MTKQIVTRIREQTNGKGGKAAVVTALTALLVSISGNATVYVDGRAARADARQARQERVVREDQFFRAQCFRDHTFSYVVIEALQDAKRRAISSLRGHPIELAHALAALDRSIAQLRILANACASQIPEP